MLSENFTKTIQRIFFIPVHKVYYRFSKVDKIQNILLKNFPFVTSTMTAVNISEFCP